MSIFDQTKRISKLSGIRPARSKGQNFLITEEIYDQVIKAADLHSSDTVLEVGPGLGFLTERLARAVKQVVAVELDEKLVGILKKRLREQGIDNVEIIQGDILKLSGGRWRFSGDYKVVANLPYQITSRFLRKFLSEHSLRTVRSSSVPSAPPMMVLMLQKEVAERIVAKPPKMSLLALSVQYFASAEIVSSVGKENFWPEPKVDSAIIKIHAKETNYNEGNEDEEKLFFRLLRIGFSAKRKKLANNLAAGFHMKPGEIKKSLKLANFNENVRAQELSLQEWEKLFVIIKPFML